MKCFLPGWSVCRRKEGREEGTKQASKRNVEETEEKKRRLARDTHLIPRTHTKHRHQPRIDPRGVKDGEDPGAVGAYRTCEGYAWFLLVLSISRRRRGSV